jgi:hypothetical protein
MLEDGTLVQEVTLKLPDALYEQVKRAADKAHRSLDDVLLDAVAAVAVMASRDVQSALAQMAYLNEAALLQAARATVPAEQRERLAELHDKQQREGLLPEEEAEEQALLALYDETLLVRAQAAVLLKRRGYDVSDPGQFEPIA